MIQTLNLANSEKTEIGYKINSFPDGQQSVTLTDPESLNANVNVKIYSRLTSFKDLELIIGATAALRNNGVKEIVLYTPYFLGARSDRRFASGDANYLKQVICPIINSQKYSAVIVLDPHSDVLEGCLDQFEKIENTIIVQQALLDMGITTPESINNVVLVSPDAGALKKVYNVAEATGIENLVIGSKHRDIKSGKILSTSVPGVENYGENHKFVIVDDICDGGRTFIELAKEIRKHNAISEIYLVVTHGIFSAGFDELEKYFTKIYTTNSVQNIVAPIIHQIDII
jgi:ribose-phosphate pyrophosphokinase